MSASMHELMKTAADYGASLVDYNLVQPMEYPFFKDISPDRFLAYCLFVRHMQPIAVLEKALQDSTLDPAVKNMVSTSAYTAFVRRTEQPAHLNTTVQAR